MTAPSSSAAAPLLQLSSLDKAFGALKVTDDITLDIAAGGCHAVIGPNGAGKTTLIHQITGALAPDSGTITFEGRDITGVPMPKRALAGLVRSFQITSILPEFSVLENVAVAVQSRSGSSFRFFRAAAGVETLNKQALAALAQVGLAARAGMQAGLLSHGEKRQLELAIALALEPKLLLLDEPMAGAGPEETRLLVETLRAIKTHTTIVLIEHDMQAVFALADRVSVLVAGRIIATDTPDAVRTNPEVKAAYLGEVGEPSGGSAEA
jgi:branched-chain amino acid transport system ATP-binding protein